MTNIMKKENGYQPVATTFGSVVDQIFQNNLSRFFDDSIWGTTTTGRQQVPVNVRETDKSYEMELIAPGLKKEDFRLNIAGDNLTVSFENQQQKEEENKKEGWIRREYQRQNFTRTFTLDDTVDAEKVTAHYENGILHLSLPKKPQAQKISKQIAVN